MPETTPLIKAALNLRVGAGFDVYDTNAGRAEMFFLFFNRTSAAGGERRQYGKVLKL